MRNSAAYVGRVGGLAIALGIGTAVVTGQGVALADSAEGVSGPTSNDSSETKPEAPNAAPSAAQADSTAPGQAVGPRSFWSPAQHRPFNGGRGIVHSSGGAQTSRNSSTSGSTPSDDPSASNPTSATDGSTTEPVDTEPSNSGPGTGTPTADQPTADPTDTSKPALNRTRHSTFISRGPSQADNKPTLEVDARPPVSGTNGTDNDAQRPGDDATLNIAAEAEAVGTDLVRNTVTSASDMALCRSPTVKRWSTSPQRNHRRRRLRRTSLPVCWPQSASARLPPATRWLRRRHAPTLFDALQMAWRDQPDLLQPKAQPSPMTPPETVS